MLHGIFNVVFTPHEDNTATNYMYHNRHRVMILHKGQCLGITHAIHDRMYSIHVGACTHVNTFEHNHISELMNNPLS